MVFSPSLINQAILEVAPQEVDYIQSMITHGWTVYVYDIQKRAAADTKYHGKGETRHGLKERSSTNIH